MDGSHQNPALPPLRRQRLRSGGEAGKRLREILTQRAEVIIRSGRDNRQLSKQLNGSTGAGFQERNPLWVKQRFSAGVSLLADIWGLSPRGIK
jgi:hypothetical protein